jgi:hypothetical protein
MSHAKPPTPLTPTNPRAISVTIPDTWTPEQALVVFELVDELRENIFALYGCRIQALLQEQQGCFEFSEGDTPVTDSAV